MRQENIEFKEALQLLASRAGVELPKYNNSENQSKPGEIESLKRINNFAAKYYHQYLLSPNGKIGSDYLMSRGLSSKTLAGWEIGYAPDEYHGLENVLKIKKFQYKI